MTDDDREDSSACYAHLLVDGHPVDPQTRADVAVFRKAERARLYALRKACPVAEQRAASARVAAALDQALPDPSGRTIAAYWPIRGELDLRDWMARAHDKGARLALPVVTQTHAPVAFHRWQPGMTMTRGIWNIPVPATAEPAPPDIIIVPLLGVDAEGYRLGNGGGYYDRTLAHLDKPARIIGVGQGFARMRTIFPMPWDIPMQQVILDDTPMDGAP